MSMYTTAVALLTGAGAPARCARRARLAMAEVMLTANTTNAILM